MEYWINAGWLTLCVVYWLLMFWGVNGNHVAWVTFQSMAWFLFLLTILAIITVTTTDIRKEPRSLPLWVGALFDVTMITYLASEGHFFYAALTLLQFCGEFLVYAPEPPRPNNIIPEITP